MSNPKIKHIRSAVPGRIPTTQQLPTGEFALNTADGKVFTSKTTGYGSTVFIVNPWEVGVGSDAYDIQFDSGNVNIGTINSQSNVTVLGNITANSFIGDLVGNIDTATKLATARTISLSGDVTGSTSFDGSSNVSIVASIVNDSHTHDTRYYTETEISNFLSGSVSINGYNKSNWDSAYSWGNHASAGYQSASTALTTSTTFGGDVSGTYNDIVVANDSHTHDTRYYTETESDARFLGISAKAADSDLLDGQEGSYYRNASNINAGTIGDAYLPDTISSNITGNAATATKLATSRTITLSGDVTGSVGFDGSANVTINATVANDSHTHDGRYYTEAEADARFLGINAKAADSELLDGINSTSFLRSDTNDNFTGTLWGNNVGGTYFNLRGGGNANTLLMRVSAAEANEDISANLSGDYGFNIRYRGDLTGVENALQIDADNQDGTAIEALRIKQNGVVYFGPNPYVGSNVIWHAGNDGAGTGLDADTLDGQQGSYYLDYNNFANTPSIPGVGDGTLTVQGSSGLTGSGTFTANQSTNTTITVSHADTSSQGSVNNSNGTVIQDVTLDDYGHVTGLASVNLDGRYYTETESDARFLEISAKAADSDLLDGQEGSYYRNASNINAGTIGDAYLPDTISSNITGNAATATKLATARTIGLSGDVTGSVSFDGSANVTITATVANDSHTHDGRYYTETEADARFLGINAKAADSELLDGINSTSFLRSDTDDTTTGNLTISKTSPKLILKDTNVDQGSYPAIQFDTTNNQGVILEHNEFDVELPISGYGLVLRESPNNGEFPTTGTLSFSVLGNIYAGGTTLGTVFTVWHAGNDGAGTGLDADLLDGQQGSYYRNASNINAGTIGDVYLPDTISSNITGNAATATKLATSRTISITGDGSGSASFDGSDNVSISLTISDDSHNHIIGNIDGLQGALDAKAPLASPALTGTPTAPTASAGTNTTQIATTAFVGTAVANLVDAAPTTLDTLNELAAALGDDPNFATTVTNSIATKLPLSGGQMTGNITFSGSQTVDGRDLSVDGSKLDGIAAGAEVNVQSDWNATSGDALILNKPTIPTNNNQLTNGAGYLPPNTDNYGGTYNIPIITGGYLYPNPTAGGVTITGTTGQITTPSHGNSSQWNTAYGWGDHASAGYQSASTALTTSTTFGGDVSGTYNAIVVANDSHTHDTRYYTETESDARFLGISAKAADSNLLDGIDSGSFLRSDANDTFSGTLTMSGGNIVFPATAGRGVYFGGETSGSDYGYIRELSNGQLAFGSDDGVKFYETDGDTLRVDWSLNSGTFNFIGTLREDGNNVWHAGNDGSGSGLDADTVDGLQASSFLRSDANDTATGLITFSNGIVVEDSSIGVGDKSDDSWTEILHSQTDGYGFDWLYDNATVIINQQGSTNQALVIGDVLETSGLFGISHTTDGGSTWTKRLDLHGNGELYIGSSGTSKVWHAGNDGSGSGLDADTLDGINSGSFLRSDANDSFSGTITGNILYVGGSKIINSAAKFQVNGFSRMGSIYIHDLSNNDDRNLNNDNGNLEWDGNKIWHAANDGSGSGLDADLLDGLHESTFMRREANSTLDMNNNDINGVDQIKHHGDTDTYMQFHASDQWRVVTGGEERLEVNNSAVTIPGVLNVRGAIDLADNDILRLGSGDDAELFCNGSHLYLDLNSGIGNFYIRDGTTTRFTFNDNGSFTVSSNLTANGVIFCNEINGRTGSQLVLNAGEAQGKFGGQTGELVYLNAEGGILVSTPDSGHSNFQSGYVQQSTRITGSYITVNGNTGWHAGNDGSGSGLDADTVDGINSGSFLRSDVNDSASGTITFNGVVKIRSALDLADNDILRFGSSDDWELFHNGTHNYMDLNVGNFYIRQNTTNRFIFHRNNGKFETSSTDTAIKAVTSGASPSDGSVLIRNTNTGVSVALLNIQSYRGATSAFNFIRTTSNVGSSGDNEHRLRGDGQAYADGSWNSGGADYAEYFEWLDGNINHEDRRGICVSLENDKIREAVDGEDPIGVISGNPSVIGDSAWNKWTEKYLKDEFNSYIMEDHSVIEWEETKEVEDENGDMVEITEIVTYEDYNIPDDVIIPENAIYKTHDENGVKFTHRKLNPDYDPNLEYIPREERPEWDAVGLVGKLRVRKGQVVGSRWIKMRDINDHIEEWLVR